MSSVTTQTNFKDSNGVDLGNKLITKDYLISVYPGIVESLGISPELWVWGDNSNGKLGTAQASTKDEFTPVTTFAGGLRWKQVSCGGYYTGAIKTDGTLWLWGRTYGGKLGNAVTNGDVSTPITTFAGGTNWKQVSCGNDCAMAIKTDGTLWVWGEGIRGRLGNADTTNRSTPVTTFAGGNNWKQVSAGCFYASAAIKTDGTLWTWIIRSADNSRYLAGHEKIIIYISTPITTFAGGTNWADVDNSKELYTIGGGTFYNLAIKNNGTLWTWGYGYRGQLGNATIATNISTPITTFSGGINWKQVSTGSDHVAAIKADGTLWVWGYTNSGELGIGDIGIQRSTPVTTFAGGSNWKQVSSGSGHTAAIKTDGTLWTWGGGSSGRLGNAVTTGSISTPVTTFTGGTDWKQVSAGNTHTAAIKTDGTLWVWGNGTDGRLGNGIITGSISTPVTTFAGGTNWKQVAGGFRHTTAIKTNGTLWTWGVGFNGRLGTNDTTPSRSTPVTTFAGGTNWKQVGSGGDHTAALKTDGTLWTWGANNYGQLGNGPNQSLTPVTTFRGGTNWKQAFASWQSTLAINGEELYLFGRNFNAELGNTSITGSISTPITTFAGGTNWADVDYSENLYTISGTNVSGAAIKTDGTLWTWGFNNSGQLGNNRVHLSSSSEHSNTSTPSTTFAGGTDWKQISCGSHIDILHSLGIKTDGTLWAWGRNDFGQLGFPPIIAISTPITTFAGGNNWADTPTTNAEDLYTLSGSSFSAAIKTDGTLWTWGNGINGQLGNSSITNRSTPITTFVGGSDWKQVSAGSGGTGSIVATIKTDGTLWTWGNGTQGALGNRLNINRSTPITTFTGGTDWKQVSAGNAHVAAIKTDGTLWTWGISSLGRLGNIITTTTVVSTPITTFTGGTDWKQVSSGIDHTAAIKTDGTLWTWGSQSVGTLGNGVILSVASTPVTTFAGGIDWKQVACGSNYTSAIKTDGTLWVWGNGGSGRLGNANTTITNSTPVTTFIGGSNWKQVSSGTEHTAAIKTDGTLWTWGNGTDGRLGNAVTTGSISTPVTTFAGGTNWKQVSAGNTHTLALIDDGVNKRLYVFGGNNTIQLGNFFIPIPQPVKVTNDINWKQVSAGNLFTAATKTDGTLWTWGNGNNGALGNGVFGGNISTPITTFAGGTNWKQISAGYLHITAIKTDGTLWTWGNGGFGRLGDAFSVNRSTPVTTFSGGTDWKQVSAGGFHTSAVKTDGTLWTWGSNTGGQLGVGIFSSLGTGYAVRTPVTTFAGGTNWTQVFSPANRISPATTQTSAWTIAVKTDGTLWTWGRNYGCELGSFPNVGVPVLQSQETNWKQVSISEYHAAAIKTDGTLWVWGNNYRDVLGDPSLSPGYDVYDNNRASARFTPITTFAGGSNWKQVSVGHQNTAAVKTDGTLWTWGNGTYGQLGRGIDGVNGKYNGYIEYPLEINPGENWNDIQLSNPEDFYSISVMDRFNPSFQGIKTDGTLWVWGNAVYGCHGDSLMFVGSNTPITTFAGGTNWKQISSLKERVAAIKTDGTLWVWGNNYFGELGTNDFSNRSTPVTTFAGGTNWKQVGVGYDYMAAIKTDGTLWTWGNGASPGSEALGRNFNLDYTRDGIISTPVTTSAGGNNWADTPTTNAEDLYTLSAASGFFSGGAAIKTDGTLWVWGTNFSNNTITRYVDRGYNQRAVDGICGARSRIPGTLRFNSDPFTGKRVTTTLNSGTVTPIANNLLGRASLSVEIDLRPQFGGEDDGFWALELPFNISYNGKTYRKIYVGTNHYITFEDGSRRLTIHERNPAYPKILISACDGSIQVLCYGTEGVAPNRTYRVRAEGQYSTGGFSDSPSMVWEATFYENAPSQFDIQIGLNQNKILDLGVAGRLVNVSSTVPITTFAGGTNWRQLSTSAGSVAAIKTDGTLWMWGLMTYGQLGNTVYYNIQSGDEFVISTPVTTFAGGTNWKQVSSAQRSTAAIKTDGTLWTWGQGSNGRLGNAVTSGNISTPVTTFAGGTNWKQVSVGYTFTAAIKTDGTLWTWGSGGSGALGNAVTSGNISTPVTTFAGGIDWKQVSCSRFSYIAAIKTDGTLWTWGSGTGGVLANGISGSLVSTPITTFAGGTNWKQVSAGLSHVAAVKTDGTLWVWGNGAVGALGNGDFGNLDIKSTPITTFAGGTNWKQVSAGDRCTVALKDDGVNKQLWTFGNNFGYALGVFRDLGKTPSTTFAGGTNWKQLSAGDYHVAAIKTDGTLWTWGFGGSGRLGNQNIFSAYTPVTTFSGGTDWKQVSAGRDHTAAIKTDGTLWTWGNSTGRLPQIVRSTPVTTFAGGNNWADTPTTNAEDLYTLSAGNNHTAAIKTDGTLWTWGNSGNGRLGNAVTTTTNSTPATTFSGGTNWKQVSSGSSHTAAIKTDGTLWVWGNGQYGRLGNSTTTVFVSTPITIFTGGTDWKQVSTGDLHTAAIKTDGTLWTWGRGQYGRLGNAVTTNVSTPVTTFTGGTDWKQVSAGWDHTAAIKTDGTLWIWGSSRFGARGDASFSFNMSTPTTTFAGGTNWKQVSCGYRYTSAIKTDGTLWMWGRGSSGQLGNADTSLSLASNLSTPVTTFAGGTNWKQVSCGNFYTAAIKTDGTLWTWGQGSNGKLGNAVTTGSISTPVTTFTGGTNWKQVSSGSNHTLALRDDGVNKQLWVFGNGSLNGYLGFYYNDNLQPNTTFAGGSDWKFVSAAKQSGSTNIIKTDGTLWEYSANSTPRIYYTGTNWSQVCQHNLTYIGLKTNGTLWIWGEIHGQGYQSPVLSEGHLPKTTFAGGTNWKQVSISYDHTAAIKTDGTLWTWGDNFSGEIGIPSSIVTAYTPITTFIGGTNWRQVVCSEQSSGPSTSTMALKSEEF